MRHRMGLAIGALLIGGATAAELLLRNAGLRCIPLYQSDQRYEYFTAPLQELRIGAVRFTTNAQGMRNPPIDRKKGHRVLVIGDSVINGGYSVDQDSLATERANAQALQYGVAIEFINLSANSWGAGNVAAFLEAHGTYDADEVIAVFSSHDAMDRMTFEPVVGVHPSFPAQHPATAIGATLQRLKFRFSSKPPPSAGPLFDPGWRQLINALADAELPFTVLFHAERDELHSRTYNTEGSQLMDSLHHWNIPISPLLPFLDASMYNDGIHLNAEGHAMLSEILWKQCMHTE